MALPNLRILNTNRALVFLMLRCIYQMIVGGFYSEVALQNQKTEGTVHTKHQEEEEEEEEFFNHYKNDLKRHAHTPSGVAGADLKS